MKFKSRVSPEEVARALEDYLCSEDVFEKLKEAGLIVEEKKDLETLCKEANHEPLFQEFIEWKLNHEKEEDWLEKARSLRVKAGEEAGFENGIYSDEEKAFEIFDCYENTIKQLDKRIKELEKTFPEVNKYTGEIMEDK